MSLTATSPFPSSTSSTSLGKPLWDVLHHQMPARTPIWFMRQAGRCLPEYRAIRDRMPTLEMFQTPDIAAEITLQPLQRFDYDGVIVYADILHIADALGCELSFKRGFGPQLARPVRTVKDFEGLRDKMQDPAGIAQSLAFITSTLKLVKPQLQNHHTLIGFAGAPWSVACYMIAGESPGLCHQVIRWMLEHEKLYHELMTCLSTITVTYLISQVEAGAEVLQIFESHAGMALSYPLYERYVLPHTSQLISALKHALPHTPLIYYVNNSSGILPLLTPILPHLSALGVDHRQSLAHITRTQSHLSSLVLQGNLDPMALYASSSVLKEQVQHLVRHGSQHPGGWICNLGWGLTPDTPLQAIADTIDWVHSGP